jgi:tRNA (mo5U34)-methyltransferase
MNDTKTILQRVNELAPWHFDIELDYGIRTGDYNEPDAVDPDKSNVATIQPEEMLSFFSKYYPQGLAGKDVLDVACNAGGYSFLAHQLGARSVTGFDVRQHWLNQAMFIKSLKYPDVKTVIFQCNSVQQFFDNEMKYYDIVIFKGIFYHLSDPIHILMQFCDAARESILVDSASSDEIPEQCFAPISESRTNVMSGIEGLAWLPGGPKVVGEILRYKGFRSVDVAYWRRGMADKARGRFRVIGTR